MLNGDNLHSLHLLKKTHKNKIDVIYIDPPYNTGSKDFVYDDAYVDDTDGYKHSKWLSFMNERLLLDTVREEKEQLFDEKQQLQDVSDRYDRVVRVLGENVVEDAVQQDIQEQKALEEKRQVEQMPKGSIHERLAWGARKSEMENQQRKKNKTKNRGMDR